MAVEHDTTADTLPDENGPGGSWSVGCVCGWAKTDRYARASGELVALLLATLYGRQHEENPINDSDEN